MRMTITSPISLSLPYRAENKRFCPLKRTKTGGTQPKLRAACFVVQFCLADADFVVFSNYCLIGTHLKLPAFSAYISQCAYEYGGHGVAVKYHIKEGTV